MAKRVSEKQQLLNKEYARLRKNLLARMKYQESKGNKVDWRSVPRKPKRVTEKSLRTFQKGNLIVQRTGEIKFKRGYNYTIQEKSDLSHETHDKTIEEMMKANREELEAKAKAKAEAKAAIGASEDSYPSPNMASYIQMVKSIVSMLPLEKSYFSRMSGRWIKSDQFTGLREKMIQLIDRAVNEEGEERMEWYYSQKTQEIADECEVIQYSSDEDTVRTHISDLADILYPSTVTYEMWSELWND